MKNIYFVINRTLNRKFWENFENSGQIGDFQGHIQKMVTWHIICGIFTADYY